MYKVTFCLLGNTKKGLYYSAEYQIACSCQENAYRQANIKLLEEYGNLMEYYTLIDHRVEIIK